MNYQVQGGGKWLKRATNSTTTTNKKENYTAYVHRQKSAKGKHKLTEIFRAGEVKQHKNRHKKEEGEIQRQICKKGKYKLTGGQTEKKLQQTQEQTQERRKRNTQVEM